MTGAQTSWFLMAWPECYPARVVYLRWTHTKAAVWGVMGMMFDWIEWAHVSGQQGLDGGALCDVNTNQTRPNIEM